MPSTDSAPCLRFGSLLHIALAALLLFIFLTSSVLARGPLHSQQPPVISSISGCVDLGNTTTQCAFPAVLTVRGSGFYTGANLSGNAQLANSPCLWLRVSLQESPLAVQSGWAPPTRRAQRLCNDSYFEWQASYFGLSMYETGVPLALTVLTGANYAASYTGVTFAPFTPPVLTGVTGCPDSSADGLSTSSCLPDRDVLTVTGSGFSMWNNTDMYVELAGYRSWVFWGQKLIVLSDSSFTLTMDDAFAYLLAEHDFGGPSLPLGLSDRYTGESVAGSGTLSVQFAPLPPPSVTGVRIAGSPTLSGASCAWTNASQLALTNCTIGVSGLTFTGNYLYGLSFSVGGLPMTVDYLNPVSARSAYMHMPYSASAFQPNTPYDLVISNGNGLNLTYAGYVSFTAAINIAYIDDCRDVGTEDSVGAVNCLPGDTLSVAVNNAPAGQPAFTVTIVAAGLANSTCADPQYSPAGKLTCTLPPRAVASTNWDALLLQWADGSSAWVPGRFFVYDDIDAARITAVTGCGAVGSANLTLTQCGGGEVLTLTGQRFLTYNYSTATLEAPPYYYNHRAPCNNWQVLNDTTAECQLPYVEDTAGVLNYYSPLLLRLLALPDYVQSNAVTVVYQPADVSAREASTAVSAATVALSVVFSVLGAAMLAGVAWWLHSRRQAQKEQSYESEVLGSAEVAHRHLVELS